MFVVQNLFTLCSLGYHGDDGQFFGSKFPTGKGFSETDVVGVGYCAVTDHAFFTLNGKNLGMKFEDVTDKLSGKKAKGKLSPVDIMPAVTAEGGATIIANFGEAPFLCEEMEALRLQ